jgi:hypothetical protein
MSLEVAQRAVRSFLDAHDAQPNQMYDIGFYGGEPLLEYKLLTEIVRFCEQCADQRGARLGFSITTNGTLLNDEIIHFLVAHRFKVWISLDGPKDMHDRYRLFRNGKDSAQKNGSYDIVMKNVCQFVQLYPDYPSRGFQLTFTATSDFDGLNEFLRSWWPDYPLSDISFVQIPASGADGERFPSFCMGCSHSAPCDDAANCREIWNLLGEVARRAEQVDTAPGDCCVAAASQTMPTESMNYTEERRSRFRTSYDRLLEECSREQEADAIRYKFPLFYLLLLRKLTSLHHRGITCGTARRVSTCRCYPGCTRTYCSTEGAYYPCEKAGCVDFCKLGDVLGDIDVKQVHRLNELCRVGGDCGNCVAGRLCTRCPVVMSRVARSSRVDALAFQEGCRDEIDGILERLQEYTDLMERNPQLVNALLKREKDSSDWINDVRIVLTEDQRSEVELGIEEFEASLACAYS